MGALQPRHDAREMGLKCGITCSMAAGTPARTPSSTPVATMTDARIVAGSCQGPKDIPASVFPGRRRRRAYLRHDFARHRRDRTVVASINEDGCTGCRICNNQCPTTPSSTSRIKKSAGSLRLVQGLRYVLAACRIRSSLVPTSTTTRSSRKSKVCCVMPLVAMAAAVKPRPTGGGHRLSLKRRRGNGELSPKRSEGRAPKGDPSQPGQRPGEQRRGRGPRALKGRNKLV
jgi:ferredoxin